MANSITIMNEVGQIHKTRAAALFLRTKGGEIMASIWGGIVRLYDGFTIRARAIV